MGAGRYGTSLSNNFQWSIFVLSREKLNITKTTEFITRFFSPQSGFLPLLETFERHCLYAIRIFLGFSSHHPRKTHPTNEVSLRMVHESFADLSSI